VKDRRGDRIKSEGSGVAVAKGARTEVQVKLDLRHIDSKEEKRRDQSANESADTSKGLDSMLK